MKKVRAKPHVRIIAWLAGKSTTSGGGTPLSTSPPLWIQWVLLAGVYFGAAKLGLSLAYLHKSASPVWPPTGIALAAILLLGYRVWPGVWLGAFLANATTTVPLATAFGISVGNTLEALAGGYLLYRFVGPGPFFSRSADVFRFVLIAGLLATTISATIGVASVALGGTAPWSMAGPIWLTWWLGDAMGAVVLAPLLLNWVESPRFVPRPSKTLEAIILGLLLVGANDVVFEGRLPIDYPFAYSVLPLLIWAAIRFGQRGATLAVAVTSTIAVWGTMNGSGPFAGRSPNESLMLLQAFMGIASFTALLLAANVSERDKAASDLLKELEGRYRLLAENATDMISLHALDGTYLYASPASRTVLGYEPEELLGRAPFDLVHPDEVETLRVEHRAILASPATRRFLTRVRRKDGSYIWVESSARIVREPGAESRASIISVSRDTTSRKQVEDALKKSEQRLLEAQKVAHVGSWEMDLATKEWSWSDEYFRIFELDPRDPELGNVRIREKVHPEDRDRNSELTWKAVRERNAYSNEFRIIRSDGEIRFIRGQGRFVPGEAGQSDRMIGTVQDITDIKKAEEEIARRTAELEQAKELSRLKDHFLSTISHEMRTPLSLILGYAELLQDEFPEDMRVAGIFEGQRRLAKHVSNILDYSALISGTLPLHKTTVDLFEIVRDVRSAHESEFEQSGLRLESEIVPSTPCFQADSRRLLQMLDELLDNARKYTPSGGSVGIRIAPVDGYIRMEVWDSGIGIAEQDLAQIWAAFTQLDIGDAFRKGGLGLGLTIVKKLTELHGGRVEVESQVGHGSHFSLILPIGSEASN